MRYTIAYPYRGIVFSVLSGLLFWLAWPPLPFYPVIFLAFIPLLQMEEELASDIHKRHGLRVFGWAYLAFLIWNASTTWWIWNSTPSGAVFAIMVNALLMCIPFMLFHQTRIVLGNRFGYLALVAYWLTFEYLHHQWELSWTWLTLGNAPAMYPSLIQWYEFTGTPGGSLWVLTVNIAIFRGLKRYGNIRDWAYRQLAQSLVKARVTAFIISFLIPLFWLLTPLLISWYIGQRWNPETDVPHGKVVAVQPNIDPYEEKFDAATYQQQLHLLLKLSAKRVDSTTRFLLWPETAIPQGLRVDDPFGNPYMKDIYAFIRQYPRLALIAGASTYYIYKNGEPLSPTARPFSNGNGFYEAYNSAVYLDAGGDFQVYHKSKLVPGVERMPYPGLFKFLEPLAIDLGGISGSLGMQDERTVFFTKDSIGVAPVICYESVYGEYVTEYIRKGAQAVFVLTNDGWWGNTLGHLQHMYYAVLRAIENRRWVVRAANTGISCFIDPQGNILKPTNYWEEAVIEETIPFLSKTTIYTLYGDYISRVAMFIAVVMLLYGFVRNITGTIKGRL